MNEYDFAMLRQHNARCDRGALVCGWLGDWDELEKMLATSSFADAVRNSRSGQTRREVFAHVPVEEKQLFAVLRHELEHLRRLNGTSLGMLFHRCMTGWSRNCQAILCSVELQKDIGEYFPVQGARLSLPSVTDIGEFADLFHGLDETQKERHQALTQLSLFQSLNSAPKDRQRFMESQLCLIQLALNSASYVPVKDSESLPLFNQSSFSLGGLHLLEFFACVEEVSSLGLFGADGVGETLKMISARSEYSEVMKWLNLCWPHLDYSRHGNLREADLIGDVYRIGSVEFWAAVELSLWSPYTPEGICLLSTGQPTSWDDIHPGLRFTSVITALADAGIQEFSTPMTDADREDVFTATQAMISQLTGWPTPEELSQKWLDALDSDGWEERPEFIGSMDIATRELARQVFRLRIEHPFDAALNNLDWNQITNTRFACWSVRTSKGAHEELKSVNNLGEQARLALLWRKAITDLITGGHQLSFYCETDRSLVVEAIDSLIGDGQASAICQAKRRLACLA